MTLDENCGKRVVLLFSTSGMPARTLALPAEAFVRHNAHDCIYPDHEKDFRVLQLFARRFMQGRLLVVLRLSHQGIVEIDTVRGTGALEAYGAVVIHRGHMRTAQCSIDRVKQLLEIAMQGERVVRELEVDGWGSFLEAQDATGDVIPSIATSLLPLPTSPDPMQGRC